MVSRYCFGSIPIIVLTRAHLFTIVGPLKLKDSQGEGDVPVHGAISLEQQDWPDGVNHPEWFHRKTLWGSLDIYNGYVAYKFKVDRKEKEATGT
jgi:hypothetical protein